MLNQIGGVVTRVGDETIGEIWSLYAPPYANLAAVYRNFDWDEPLRFVHKSAGLSDQVLGGIIVAPAEAAVRKLPAVLEELQRLWCVLRDAPFGPSSA